MAGLPDSFQPPDELSGGLSVEQHENKMQAAVYHRYGPPNVVVVTAVPKPVPARNEVLIRIHATTVSTGDWRARSLDMPGGMRLLAPLVFGVFGPRQPILGTELAGVASLSLPQADNPHLGNVELATRFAEGGWRALSRAAPRHTDDAGQSQGKQPQRRAAPVRSGSLQLHRLAGWI